MWAITHNSLFLNWVLVLILLSCIQLGWETYSSSDLEDQILMGIDYLLTTCFTVEMICKIISNTLYNAPDAYLRNAANLLDGFIVCVSIISLSLSSLDLDFLRSLRALRCIRPLRIMSRSESMMIVIKALILSIPGIANVSAFFLCIFVVFGILGSTLFRGQSSPYCSDPSITIEDLCTGDFTNSATRVVSREWVTTTASFDNIMAAMITLLEISTLEGWSGYMHFYIHRPDGNGAEALFFLLWIMISAFFMLNLFIGIVFQEFQRAAEGPGGFSMLTPAQQDWVMTAKNLFTLKPTPPKVEPINPVRAAAWRFVHHPKFETGIAVLIMTNVVVLMMHHHNIEAGWSITLQFFTWFFNVCFALEAVLKIIAFGWKMYVADGWNKFDIFLVCASGVDVLMDLGLIPEEGGAVVSVIRVFRIFRVMRMFRLVKHFSSLRKMASVLLVSLPSIINVGSLLLLFYFMFGVLGCSFFKDVSIDGEGVTRHSNFRDLGFAMLTLFRISTGEDWHTIMHDCMVVTKVAPLYFVTFILLIMFVLINVFVACVVDNMKATQGAEALNYDNFASIWTTYDAEITWYIAADDLPDLLLNLGPPLGLGGAQPGENVEVMKFISDLNIPSHEGRHHFSEVLYCLARRLGGVSLPESSLATQIEGEMKKIFPVYQRNPASIITAVQRIAVYKFVQRLRMKMILRRYTAYEETQEPFVNTLKGVTQEEALAGAIILKHVRHMVQSCDPIRSEDLSEERAILLDPLSAPGRYAGRMAKRKKDRQIEMKRAKRSGQVLPGKSSRRNSEICGTPPTQTPALGPATTPPTQTPVLDSQDATGAVE